MAVSCATESKMPKDYSISLLFGVFPILEKVMGPLPTLQEFIQISHNTVICCYFSIAETIILVEEQLRLWRRFLKQNAFTALMKKAKQAMKDIIWLRGMSSRASQKRGIISYCGFSETIFPPQIQAGFIAYTANVGGKKSLLYFDLCGNHEIGSPVV